MIKHPFSLVVYGQKLFVTDWRLDAIIKMDKLSGGNEVIVEKVEESNRLYGIKIYSEVNNFDVIKYTRTSVTPRHHLVLVGILKE